MTLGKWLLAIGIVFIFVGLSLEYGGKYFPLGRLPGDILIKKENSTLYSPITSSLLVSVFLSLLAYFFRK